MGILTHLKLLFLGMLSNILPFLSYKGVVNTQIALYKKIRSREPEIPEDDLLNVLLVSRIESIPRVASKEQEYRHYESRLRSSEKTLKDVIWAIIEYEYILSREEHLLSQAVRIGSSQEDFLSNVDTFEANVKRYIEQRIGTMGTGKEQTTWFVLALLVVVFISIIAARFSNTPATTRADNRDVANEFGFVPLQQQRDLSTPSTRLEGHWRNEKGTTDLYYSITEPSLKIGYFIIHNKRGRPGAPIRFKILSEEPSGDRLIVRQFQDFRRLQLVLGYRITQSAVTHCIPKHGQSMTQEQTHMGDPMLSVYRYVDDKTRP